MSLRVTLLAGGVGGAKMAEGLYGLSDVELTVIGNIADDQEFHGLWVSPDIDTLTYTLSGRINRSQGWGVADDGLRALETLGDLGEDTWMTLGDRDLGLHIHRTMRRRRGDRPSAIAADVARAFGVTCRIVLPTDDVVQTQIKTHDGWIGFQEYFVRDRHEPEVLDYTFAGAADARATPEALDAIWSANVIIFAPSNPILSIAPILAVAGIRDAIAESPAPKVAISPLIAGAAVKGAALPMMRAAGLTLNSSGVASHYGGLLDHFVIDHQDRALAGTIKGPRVFCTEIMMRDHHDKMRLARDVLDVVGPAVPV